MLEQELELIGLTKREIAVYLSLLKLGETTTGPLIDKSKVSSGKIYEILEKLIQKGLVTYIIKNKTKYFQTTNPKKIVEFIDLKKKEIEKTKQRAQSIIPELVRLHDKKESDYQAIIYKGLEGFKTAIFETLNKLNKDDEWLAMGVTGEISKNIIRIWSQFNLERVRKKVVAKMIVTTTKVMQRHEKMLYLEMRLLSLVGTVPISIAGDVVIIYNWEDLSIIKITNKNVAQSFRDFFNTLWEISKE